MDNFQHTLNKLLTERGLSSKQLASFTGAELKEVKKWQSGTSFPTNEKIINALEGLLGTEITKTLKGYSYSTVKNNDSAEFEDSLFNITKEEFVIKKTKVDKFRTIFQKTNRERLTNTSYKELENKTEAESSLTDVDLRTTNSEDIFISVEEEPYINDDSQIIFYLLRNIKTGALLLFLLSIAATTLGLSWNSFSTLINNLL